MNFDPQSDILPTLTWTKENADKQAQQKTTIFYFALTTCAYCKKGLMWMKDRNTALQWMYLDLLPLDQKNAIKTWLKNRYKLTSEVGMPFVVFRQGKDEFISNGFDLEYWKAKAK